MSISELRFFDLFLTRDPEKCWFKESPGSCERTYVPKKDHPELTEFYGKLVINAASEFKIDWNDIRYRVERRNLAIGETIFVCRRFMVRPNKLSELSFPLALANKLLEAETKDGLIIFLGRIGTGKSTVAGTLVKERLSIHGGVAWTIENPVEADLSGPHGNGICYQTEVMNEDDVGKEIVCTLRSSPNLIYIGEIRKDSAALEALHASISGHLVISTHHGNDVQTGLARLSTKAGSPSILADALRAAIYLDLKKISSGQLRLATETLWVSGTSNEDAIRSTLRKGEYHLLSNFIERQKRLLQEGKEL